MATPLRGQSESNPFHGSTWFYNVATIRVAHMYIRRVREISVHCNSAGSKPSSFFRPSIALWVLLAKIEIMAERKRLGARVERIKY